MAARQQTMSANQIAQMQANADQAADLLKALANGQRLRMLCLLVGGELSVGDINAQVDLSQSALSQHLAVLREQGLVNTRKQAQTVYYSLAEGPAGELIAILHRAFCGAETKARGRRRQNAA